MDDFLGIYLAVLPPFLLLGLGGLARKLKWLRAEADASLSMITIRILYPCFIFHHILSSNITIDLTTLGFPIFGFTSIVAGFTIACIVSKLFRLEKSEAPTFRFCSGIFNYGFIAIPVALTLFTPEIVVYIILFNLGVEIAIWTVGIFILTDGKLNLAGFLNPPAITIVVALFLQETVGRNLVPSILWEVITALGNCSIPIGLILIGANFYQLFGEFKFSPFYRVEISSLLVRNLIFPVLCLTIIYLALVPEGVQWLKEVIIIQCAMPAGIFAVVIVRNYDGDTTTAIRTIPITMILGLISSPIWLFLGYSLL